MEFSTTRLEEIAKLLAEEIKEQLAEKQGINEMEQMVRELIKEAAGSVDYAPRLPCKKTALK